MIAAPTEADFLILTVNLSKLRSSLRAQNLTLRRLNAVKPVSDGGEGDLEGYAGLTAASIG